MTCEGGREQTDSISATSFSVPSEAVDGGLHGPLLHDHENSFYGLAATPKYRNTEEKEDWHEGWVRRTPRMLYRVAGSPPPPRGRMGVEAAAAVGTPAEDAGLSDFTGLDREMERRSALAGDAEGAVVDDERTETGSVAASSSVKSFLNKPPRWDIKQILVWHCFRCVPQKVGINSENCIVNSIHDG